MSIEVTCKYCGKIENVPPARAKGYHCCSREHQKLWLNENPSVDRVGFRSGSLTVIGYSGIRENRRSGKGYYWICMCDCGSVITAPWRYIQNRHRSSCGCQARAGLLGMGGKNKLEFGESRFNELYMSYRNRAKKKGLDFQIGKHYFAELTQSNCYYCNQPPSQQWTRVIGQYGNYTYTGVDRIDSSKGYILGNVRPSCGQCNKAKGIMSADDFLAWIKRVHVCIFGDDDNA